MINEVEIGELLLSIGEADTPAQEASRKLYEAANYLKWLLNPEMYDVRNVKDIDHEIEVTQDLIKKLSDMFVIFNPEYKTFLGYINRKINDLIESYTGEAEV